MNHIEINDKTCYYEYTKRSYSAYVGNSVNGLTVPQQGVQLQPARSWKKGGHSDGKSFTEWGI